MLLSQGWGGTPSGWVFAPDPSVPPPLMALMVGVGVGQTGLRQVPSG